MTPTAAGILGGPLRVATIGIVGLVSLIAFEAMAVATALPTAVAELDGLAWYGWSFTALLVVSVVGMVTAGELSDRIGARPPLLGGVAAFLTGLVVAGLAPSMPVFVLGRALQGLGVGMLAVVLYVIVGAVYPPEARPRVFGAISAAWVLPALVGPVVAGWLAAGVGWRWAFLGLVPLVVAGFTALLPVSRQLGPPDEPPPPRPRRWGAAVLAGSGVAMVQAGLQAASWGSAPLLAVGVALLAVGLREVLPRGTVRIRRGLPAVVAFRGMLAGAFFSVESLVPLTLTLVHGYSPTGAGVPLTGGALGWAAASWWQGRNPGVPRHLLVRAGFVLVAVAAGGMAVVSQPTGPAWLVYPVWVAGGFGMGLAMSSIGVLLLALAAADERGSASSSLQISDAVTSAVCIGIAGALVAATERGALELPMAASALDVVMVGVAVLGAVLAGRARAQRTS